MGKLLRKMMMVIFVSVLFVQMIFADESGAPVSLYDLTWEAPEPGQTLRKVDGVTDIFGNGYGRGITGTTSNVDNYGDYILNGAYDVLSGIVVRNAGTNPAVDLRDPYRTDICVYVYGDGELLYQSRSVNLEGNEVQRFAVDITGVDTLRIAVNGKKYISVSNAVLLKDAETEEETTAPLWSALTQECGSEVYTSMNLWDGGDTEYLKDKEFLSFAAGSEFICYDDRVYYTESHENIYCAPLYSAARDGSEAYLIDEYFQNETKFVIAEGMLFYTRGTAAVSPSKVMCYDMDSGEISTVREGRLLCSGYGYLYIVDENGVYRIDPKHPSTFGVQVAAQQTLLYTENEIVRSEPVSDGNGNLEYSLYDMKDGSVRFVTVPDTYTEGIYDRTPYAFAGEYVFVYGSNMLSQYQVTDGTLIQQIEVDDELSFQQGPTVHYNQKCISIFNEDAWHVFSAKTNGWTANISPAEVTQTIYTWLKENAKAMTEWGMEMPQSADGLPIRNKYVAYVSEDSIYLACETDPYSRNDKEGNMAIQNIWIVKVGQDGKSSVVGSEFWQ